MNRPDRVINLQKGQKNDIGLTKMNVGLGWKPKNLIFMNRKFFFIAITFVILGFSGCTKCTKQYLEVDVQQLQEKIFEPTAVKYEALQPSTVLYLDHSTCIIDAVQNSAVFKALRPNLGQYSDTLQLIKGANFEAVPLNREANKVSEALEKIKEDISFADIRKAIFQICNDNQQAVLITDCESYFNERFLDFEPYMTEPFINWLRKGYVIYVVVEPYNEKYKGEIYNKKRFYFFFTDDRIVAPISNNMLAQLEPLKKNNLFTIFKLTNSDIFVQRDGKMLSDDLDVNEVVEKNGFEFTQIFMFN